MQNCKMCRWDKPGDCVHNKNKGLKFWDRVGDCSYYEKRKEFCDTEEEDESEDF